MQEITKQIQQSEEEIREEFEVCYCSDIQKAIKELYIIVGMHQITPEITETARFMLENYEQEKGAKYVRYLQERIKKLSEQRASAVLEFIEGVREGVEELGHQQDDDTIWCEMDKVLALLNKAKDNLNQK